MAKKPQTDTDEVKLSHLEQLTAARDIKGIAKLIGYPTKSLAYVLYKIPNENKYRTFSIPKKNGDERIIHAPNAELKIIQKRLATFLLNCIKEIEDNNEGRKTLSHAFQADRSIVTNAAIHTNRRYVLNLDLENFFGTINFGRVRGFFIKDRNFKLSEKAATILAQIACHNNCLPQGSPCSPVISNLIGHIIDVRLARLAKVYKCTYSRYADDITFSTNQKSFPKHLAKKMLFSTNKWKIGAKLKKEIIRCGFALNESKTRMQIRGSRQETTGLVVNSKVNIKQEYYRNVRAMCHSLFTTGTYYIQGNFDEAGVVKKETNLKKLEGMLCHIDYVKQKRNLKDRKKKKGLMPDALQNLPEAPKELYEKFLFYKYFLANDKPLLLTEGKTDITYLKSAITSLQSNNTTFFKEKEFLVSFFNNSQTKREILGINEGAGSFPFLIANYANKIKRYKNQPKQNPVVIIIDNDDVVKQLPQKEIKILTGSPIDISSTKPFYYLGENLYLVKTPESGSSTTCIENCFKKKTLDVKLGGKSFDLNKKYEDEKTYGKEVFAKQVVVKQHSSIDFSGFQPLLDRINAVIEDYSTKIVKS